MSLSAFVQIFVTTKCFNMLNKAAKLPFSETAGSFTASYQHSVKLDDNQKTQNRSLKMVLESI